MKYLYKDGEGNLIDIDFPMGQAPDSVGLEADGTVVISGDGKLDELLEAGELVSVYRRAYVPIAAHFKGGGWASKS